jgi:hypothetical protein
MYCTIAENDVGAPKKQIIFSAIILYILHTNVEFSLLLSVKLSLLFISAWIFFLIAIPLFG